MAEPPSSPPSGTTSVEGALAWYKSQYEQLEAELSEFQASSKELEAELEKDLDAADKRERSLQQKAESLNYEVEEWKVGCRSSWARVTVLQADHGISAAEIQGVEARSERGAKCSGKGDHHSARLEPDIALETSGYRGGKRRLRAASAQHHVVIVRSRVQVQCLNRKSGHAGRGD